jgi:hypothetical protein
MSFTQRAERKLLNTQSLKTSYRSLRHVLRSLREIKVEVIFETILHLNKIIIR